MTERRTGNAISKGTLIKPGTILVTSEEGFLFSVLGSGVSVCIWDEKSHIAGMNHFLEPSMYDRSKTTARYGNIAMVVLINSIREIAPEGTFEAHIFGGANKHNSDIAEQNIAIARKVLSSRKIPVVSEDVGGTKGRKIAFDTSSGHIAVLKVHTLRKEDWL